MKNSIQVTRSSLPPFEEYVDEIKSLWDTRWLSNMGEKHNRLERQLSDFLRTPNISLFTNGHSALEVAIGALNLTGEVITTPFTFVSTTHAIVRNGLTPVFCDINPDDYTIQVESIEELITEKTSAIIPVHVYGNLCNYDEIERIANKYDLKVIYDAAHAFGVTYNGKGVANFGDVSMFSFHATKVFNTIEGGALTFNDSRLEKVFQAFKNFGITGQDSVEYIAGNFKMNEFQAAMGIINLKYVEKNIKNRKRVYNKYFELLSDIKGIKLNNLQEGVESNYAYFPVVFDGYKRSRDEVLETLKNHNIFGRKYFYPLTKDFSCYNTHYDNVMTPTASYISDRILTLPLYPDLELEKVEEICNLIIKG